MCFLYLKLILDIKLDIKDIYGIKSISFFFRMNYFREIKKLK